MRDGGERRALYTAMAMVFVAGVIYGLVPVATLFFWAVLFAYIVDRLVWRLKALRDPGTAAILFLMLFAMALLVTLVSVAIKDVPMFSAYASDYRDWLKGQIEHATPGRYTLGLSMLKCRIFQQWQSLGAGVGKLLSVATYSGLHLWDWALPILAVTTAWVRRVYARHQESAWSE